MDILLQDDEDDLPLMDRPIKAKPIVYGAVLDDSGVDGQDDNGSPGGDLLIY